METTTPPEVRKSGGLIGAEVCGLDLTRQYPDETYQQILRAWAEHGVIFLRDQHLNAEQRDAFASRLGEIRVRQELRKEPEQTKAIGEGWHTDMTCFEEPPKATMLFCEEVPPWGGDTQWAAMGPTFEALSAGLQATLLGLGAVHANVRKLGYSYAQTDPPEPSIAEYDAAEGPSTRWSG
jgi:taurine dioxygenase